MRFFFLQVLTDLMWIIDGHHETINEAAKQGHMQKMIPIHLGKLSGYFDPKTTKKSSRLDSEKLEAHSDRLNSVLLTSWMLRDNFKPLKCELDHLSTVIRQYIVYLAKKNADRKRHHESNEPARNFLKDGEVQTVEKKGQIQIKYRSLNSQLASSDVYDPVCLNDQDYFSSESKYARYQFIQNLEVSVPVQLYRYTPGGNIRTLIFIWRIPDDARQRQESKILSLLNDVGKQLPVYHTRAMRRDFKNNFKRLSNLSPTILTKIYQDLTGDSSVPQNQDILDRIEILVHNPELIDENFVFDLRELNNGRPSKFEKFYEYTEQYINTIGEAADERRHGFSRLPIAISMENLIENVKSTIPEDMRANTAIPSTEQLRLQFLPPSMASNTHIKYKGRFGLKFKCQRRMLRKHNPDSEYAFRQIQYLKEFACIFRDFTTFISADDKHSIQIGEPSNPVAALDRGRRVLTSVSRPVQALDHDFTKFKVVPSVSLVVDIPENSNESFYRGDVHVNLHDAIFSPSSSLMHAEKFSHLCEDKPILLLLTDGGPDHNLTFGSVKLSLIALFKKMNLDMLVAVRPAAGQSCVNMVERIMSILNLALYGVALERGKMVDNHEWRVKGLGNMNEIRAAGEKDNELRNELGISVQKPMGIIHERFNQLKLKERPISCNTSAPTPQEIDDFFQFAKSVDNSLTKETTQKAQLQKCAVYLDWMKRHSIEHHYTFQIKKCGNPDCCDLHRVPEHIRSNLHFIPDPTIMNRDSTDASKKFHKFTALYGKESTTEGDRPSLGDVATQTDKMNRNFFTGQRARILVKCTECTKPRVVYSNAKLDTKTTKMIERISSECIYTCGASLTEGADNPPFITRVSISCLSPIEMAYYASGKFPNICCRCGESDCAIDWDLKKEYKTVHPICARCSTTQKPVVWGKLHAGKTGKKRSAEDAL